MNDASPEDPSTRVQTRRSSRSVNSGSPALGNSDSQDVDGTPPSSRSSSPEANARVTRSQSTEPNTATPITRKRRRKGGVPGSSKKRTDSPSSNNSSNGNKRDASAREDERETRNTTQRMTKEAREARKAERETIIKQRLSELDQLEKAVRDGHHPEYHQLLQDIDAKREKRLSVLKAWHSLTEMNIRNGLESDKKMAFDQFHFEKLALRRLMMQEVQQKINTLEQEYISINVQSTFDSEQLTDWDPPARAPMISSLTLGLSDKDAEDDLGLARKEPEDGDDNNDTGEDKTTITDTAVSYYHPVKSKSPPSESLPTTTAESNSHIPSAEVESSSMKLPPLSSRYPGEH